MALVEQAATQRKKIIQDIETIKARQLAARTLPLPIGVVT